MISYPLHFSVTARAPSGISGGWDAGVPGGGEVKAAIPPEFGGAGGGFSPEDFYALAALNCFVATFKVMAEKSRLEFATIEASGDLTVDRGDEGAPWMSHFALKARLRGATDPERARRVLEKASQSCIVLNSIRTPKTFSFEVD